MLTSFKWWDPFNMISLSEKLPFFFFFFNVINEAYTYNDLLFLWSCRLLSILRNCFIFHPNWTPLFSNLPLHFLCICSYHPCIACPCYCWFWLIYLTSHVFLFRSAQWVFHALESYYASVLTVFRTGVVFVTISHFIFVSYAFLFWYFLNYSFLL